ncbi:MAG: recombination protein O N-terminal domain-containing protein [Bacteroidales bacterium]|nr:recombination protein O N-terminal domain-containing protein [Bacteroidales bacterium]
MTPTLSTPALVLHTTAYSETSVIAKIFTRQLGVRSYIIKGVRKGGGRTKQNLLQPLSHLDLVVYNNPKTQINYIKEIGPHIGPSTSHAFEQSSNQAIHNALRFFMTEVLYKTLKEEEPMPELFDYVVDSSCFNDSDQRLSQHPILFLLKVSRHLGIEPMDNYSHREPLFDMMSGRFQYAGDQTLDATISLLLHLYLQSMHTGSPLPIASLPQRTELINRLLDYYQMHLAEFHNFKSHEILHSVLQ